MPLLRSADYRRVPWRNGRGETLEIARAEGVTASGAPVWRLSRAALTEAGPFSAFPEYVRWLTVVRGAGLRLTAPGSTRPCVWARRCGWRRTIRQGITGSHTATPRPRAR